MGTSDDWFYAWGPTRLPSYSTGTSDYHYGVRAFGLRAGVRGQAGTDPGPDTKITSVLAGVAGTSSNGIGVRGTSFNNVGIYGQNGKKTLVPGGLQAGVLGSAESQPGVLAWSIGLPLFSQKNDGIWGITGDEHRIGNQPLAAMRAVAFYGPGTYALSSGDVGVWGIQDRLGPQVPNLGYTAGITGSSDQQPGVLGTSNASVGVYGFSNNVGVITITLRRFVAGSGRRPPHHKPTYAVQQKSTTRSPRRREQAASAVP